MKTSPFIAGVAEQSGETMRHLLGDGSSGVYDALLFFGMVIVAVLIWAWRRHVESRPSSDE